MEGGEQLNADGLIEFRESSLIAFCSSDVVAGGKRVFRVETDAQAVTLSGGVDDVADLFEAIAEIGALTGGDLERHLDLEAGAGFMDFVERSGNGLYPFGFAGADMGAGMGDQIRNSEHFTTFHLVDERANGTFAQYRIG